MSAGDQWIVDEFLLNKIVNLNFGLRPNLSPQIKLYSQSPQD